MRNPILVLTFIFFYQNITVLNASLILLAGQSNAVGQGDSVKSVKC